MTYVRIAQEGNPLKIFQEYISTITSKGQVTVPVEIRRALGLKSQDKVVFRIVDDRVIVEPLPMTLEEAYGSVEPLQTPEDFEALRSAVREERVEKVMTKQSQQ
jgi:AbrB family looped-hinge helix DNA binding protein